MKLKRLISAAISAALAVTSAISAMTVTSFAASAPDIISLSTESTSVDAGKDVTVSIYFINGAPVAATDVTLKINGSDELTMTDGSDTIYNMEFNKQYNYKFSAPTTYTHTEQKVSYTVSYTYTADGAPVNQSMTYSTSVHINETASVKNLTVENVKPSSKEVPAETAFTVSADLYNNQKAAINDIVLSVKDASGNSYARKYIRTIAALSGDTYTLDIPEFKEAGQKKLYLSVEYTSTSGKAVSEKYDFSVAITEVEKTATVKLENVAPETEKVLAGAATNINADVINTGNTDAKDVSLTLLDADGNVLSTKYIGTAAAASSAAAVIKVPAFSTAGKKELTLKAVYTNADGDKKSVKKSVSVTITESVGLEITNLSYTKRMGLTADKTVAFKLVNNTDEEYKSCKATVLSGKTELGTEFIGLSAAQTQTEATASFKYDKVGTTKLTLKVTYINTAGKTLTETVNFTVEIFDDEETGMNNGYSALGYLKIQSVSVPLNPVKETQASLPFAVTNPTNIEIKGAEASLFGSDGQQIDSVYISSLAGNTSADFNFDISEKKAGTYTYKIVINYLNKENEALSASRSVDVTYVEVSKEEAEKEGNANVKIQKIGNPMNIYTNVKTAITSTLVNAGKGTAYNAELFVLDENGETIANEYIGNINASSSIDAPFSLKFNETGSRVLTFKVIYYDTNENEKNVEKSFEQNVVDYRASITDFAGFDYITDGTPATIEFTIINSGSENLLNTTAYLKDDNGMQYAQLYVGTINAGEKKERQRMKNVLIPSDNGEACTKNLTLYVEYENADMQVFSFQTNGIANIQPMIDYSMMDSGDMGMSEGLMGEDGGEMVDGAAAEGEGIQWWVFALIGGGALVIIVIVIVVVVKAKKRKSKKEDDDDIDYLKALNNVNSDKKD